MYQVSCEWDRHGWLVGRSVDASVLIDHASVGLARACPNYLSTMYNPIQRNNLNSRSLSSIPI